jgi:VanZ family protein
MEPAHARRRRVRAWLAVGAWAALILILGGDDFSAQDTRGWLRELVFRFFPALTDALLDRANYFVRRGAHVGFYAVLGFLAYRALRLSSVRVTAAALGLALLLALSVAAADEGLQSRRLGRTGSPRDAALDLASASGGALLLAAFERRRRHRSRAADA